MTDTDIRDLLTLAAGSPEPGPLLVQVRRKARLARRRRQAATALATVVALSVVATGTAVALHSPDRRSVLVEASPAPSSAGPSAVTSPPAPAPSASPSSSAPTPSPGETFSVENPTGTGPCTLDQLIAGQVADVHVLAGQETMDVPIQAKTPCELTLGDLMLTPDAGVPVTRTATHPLTISTRGIVHLLLAGESDGFCVGQPDAKHVGVSVGGHLLTTVQLPSELGLCTTITASLQQKSLGGGETPECTAGNLTGYPLPLAGGNGTAEVDVLLRNDSPSVCALAGYPSQATAGTADGVVTDLQPSIGDSAANGVTLQPGGYGFVGVGGLNAYSCSHGELSPVRNGPWVELSLGLEDGGTVAVSFAGSPFNFPCGPVQTTAFQPVPAGALGPSLTVTPTAAPVGSDVRASGSVGNRSICPVVDVTVASDGASGAGGNYRVQVVGDPAHIGGTFSVQVPVPAARDGSPGTGTAAVVRAFCDTSNGSATNAGDQPTADITRTG